MIHRSRDQRQQLTHLLGVDRLPQLVPPAGDDAACGGPKDRRGKSGEPTGRDARLAGARTVTGGGAGRHGGGSDTTIH